jgi:ABC-type transport system substrate-binding protein
MAAIDGTWNTVVKSPLGDNAAVVTIKSDATRLAALASGEVDLVLDPPYQDVARDPVPLVVKDQTWWTSDPNLNGFLAMPHVPWFSNCDGYDSYMVSRGRARARALGRARD